jgi:type 1 fimbria pilin
MRTLLSGAAIAVVAALAITAPASAQRSGPGPTAQTGTGPGVIPPGGFGPSETSLFNLPYGSQGLPYPVFYGRTPATTAAPQSAKVPEDLQPSQ